ncbi:MAG: hypothetical protein AAF415_20560 [Pseudomonadota bacterium]
MIHLASIPAPTASQAIGVLIFEILALAVATTLSEERFRKVMPVLGAIYAVSLPLVLWFFRP